MNDADFTQLARQYRFLVRKIAGEEWHRIGCPAGILPRDLFNDGFFGLWEAAEQTGSLKANLQPFKLRAAVRIRSRIKDALKRQQTGAVTTKKVDWPQGSYRPERYPGGIHGRFAYSDAVGVDQMSLLSGRPTRSPAPDTIAGDAALRRRLRERPFEDFTEDVVAKLDLDRAIESIPDPLDRFLVWLLRRFVDGALPSPPEEVKGALEEAFIRYKGARNITLWLATSFMSRDEAKKRLIRAGRWIEACSRVEETNGPAA